MRSLILAAALGFAGVSTATAATFTFEGAGDGATLGSQTVDGLTATFSCPAGSNGISFGGSCTTFSYDDRAQDAFFPNNRLPDGLDPEAFGSLGLTNDPDMNGGLQNTGNYEFVFSKAITEILLTAGRDNGTGIDNITVNPVPLPGAALLFAGAMAAGAAVRRKRL
jgi:hypothetical protein